MNKSIILDIQNLRVERDIVILNQINWQIHDGEHWVILGANGSGKTTLLNTLMAYKAPTRGTVTICSQTYGQSDWREVRKSLGMVSSQLTERLAPSIIVRKIIESGKEAMFRSDGMMKKTEQDRVDEILQQIQADTIQNRPWRYLSQGEKQRVLIGRALMAELKVLILDEPCAGLDPAARHRFLQFIGTLSKSPECPAMIYVTHHVEEIVSSFTHVLVLKEGQVLASGKKENVLNSKILSEAFGMPFSVEFKYNGDVQLYRTG